MATAWLTENMTGGGQRGDGCGGGVGWTVAGYDVPESSAFFGDMSHGCRLSLRWERAAERAVAQPAAVSTDRHQLRAASLNLSRQELGDAAIVELCAELLRLATTSNNAATSLDVSHNAFSGAGTAALAELVAGNIPGLSKLDLSGNPLDPVGCMKLSKALLGNPHIVSLQLSNCGSHVAQVLMAMMRRGSGGGAKKGVPCGVGTGNVHGGEEISGGVVEETGKAGTEVGGEEGTEGGGGGEEKGASKDDAFPPPPPQSAFYKRVVMGDLEYCRNKAKVAPLKIARDARSYGVEASFLASRACAELVEATSLQVSLAYGADLRPCGEPPIDSRFALLLRDFPPSEGWTQQPALGLDEARATLTALATMHGFFWHGSFFWTRGEAAGVAA